MRRVFALFGFVVGVRQGLWDPVSRGEGFYVTLLAVLLGRLWLAEELAWGPTEHPCSNRAF